MIDFLDVCKRAYDGPLMTENEFDLNIFIPMIGQVIDEFGIKYDKENPLPSDDNAADNIFEAALEFLSRVGIYCQDTNKIIQISKEEIIAAIKSAPGECLFGEGKDAKVFGMRMPDDPKRPWIHVGSGVVTLPEEMATNLMEGYASIKEANGICNCHLSDIRGIPVSAGSPVEIFAAIRGIRITREACRRAGRPGLPIMNLVSASANGTTTIAASAPQFGLRPTDAWGAPFTSELKLSFDVMNRIAYCLNWGANIRPSASPLLGGYCGGPEGTAVLCVAYVLAGLTASQGNVCELFPIHFTHGASSSRDVLWAVSSSCQAAVRNIKMPIEWLGLMAAGPNTEMYFREAAAYALCAVTSGAPGIKQSSPVKCSDPERFTPLVGKFGAEIAIGASKLTRDKARGIVLQLLEKYESRILNPPLGDRYQDLYDNITGKPKDEYVRLYDQMKEEIATLGVPFE